MNPLSQRTFNLLLIGIAAGIVLLAFSTRWYIDTVESNRRAELASAQNEMQMQLGETRTRLADLERIADALVSANKNVAAKLADEQAKRIAADKERASQEAAARQQINKLQQDLVNSQAPNLAEIISAWRPRVAQLICSWPSRGAQSSGSGVLLMQSPVTVVTNRHVVTYNGQTADSCTVKLPDDAVASIVYSADIAISGESSDWAKMTLRKPTAYATSLTGIAARCTAKPASGDSVVILGYPAVGAQGDVTATEGIISGFEGDYFISSAKVERGNSGGAAILAKQNCYLGIPSYVGAGQIESLARILYQKVIFP